MAFNLIVIFRHFWLNLLMLKQSLIASYDNKTIHGYDFFEVSSAMQKAIRRGDACVAGITLLWNCGHSNYRDYVWKRLFTISAEGLLRNSSQGD